MRVNPRITLPILAAIIAAPGVHARSTDRELPADIDAGAMTRETSTAHLSKGVILKQGTLEVRAQDAVVSSNPAGELTQVRLTGSPATWSEELDDGARMDAEALQIDYDFKSERVVLTGEVVINRGSDQITGNEVRYDLKTSRLDAGSDGGGRIKMRITPTRASGNGDSNGS